eukprot:symbB.v1.2.024865.t2/scaffold2382.1/size80501/4
MLLCLSDQRLPGKDGRLAVMCTHLTFPHSRYDERSREAQILACLDACERHANLLQAQAKFNPDNGKLCMVNLSANMESKKPSAAEYDISKLSIREATPLDILASIEVHKAAFGPEEGEVIAKLVEDLHQDDTARPLLSLVASIGDKVVGHVLFTNAWLAPASTAKAVILAPLAVHPDLQRQGVGAKLIADGLRRLREGAVDLATYEIKPENAGAWMVQELQAGALDKFHGKVQCAASSGLPLILAGDLNGPSGDKVGLRLVQADFHNVWDEVKSAPCQITHCDHRGNQFTSDHIWLRQPARAAFETESATLLPEDTPDTTPMSRPSPGQAQRGPLLPQTFEDWCNLSDHRPLMAELRWRLGGE